VLRREVVQERLFADADRLRDRLERRPGVPLSAELTDGLLDDRGLPPLATRAGHRSVPGLRSSAAPDRTRSFPRAPPRRADRPRERGRLAALGPRDGLEPRRAVLVEQLGDRLLHPERQALVRLPILGVDRVAVADRHDGPALP